MSVQNFFGMEFRDLGAWESIPGFETLSGKCSEAGKSVPKPGMDFTFPGCVLGTPPQMLGHFAWDGLYPPGSQSTIPYLGTHLGLSPEAWDGLYPPGSRSTIPDLGIHLGWSSEAWDGLYPPGSQSTIPYLGTHLGLSPEAWDGLNAPGSQNTIPDIRTHLGLSPEAWDGLNAIPDLGTL
ncbi:hypothetical protein V8E53_011571 [Lactarius tabidus]